MSASLTILLVSLAASGGDDPLTPAVARATQQAFGPDTHVVLESVPALPNDEDAAALGARAHADVVVEVAWKLPERLEVTIRLERASSEHWVEREIGFQPADEPLERSRTVAFTIASMLPEYFLQAAPTGAKGSRPPPAEQPTRPANDNGKTEPRGGVLIHRATLSGSVDTAFGVRDDGTSIGGVLDFRYALGTRVSFRIGASARVGQDARAQAVTQFFNGALGLAYNAWISRNSRAAVGLRVDALTVAAVFSRVSAETATTVYRPKWMPGSDFLAEACYFFAESAAVVLAAGGEAVFGQTNVVVDGKTVSTYDPVHPVAELGLRAGF